MRARNLKPGFFTNDRLVECEPLARIMFSGLWCAADREGRLEDRPKKLKIDLLPCDNCDPDALLQQLHDRGLIKRYTVDGQNYIQVINFHKHQKPHLKESASTIPEPGKETHQHQPRQVQAPTQAIASPASCLNPESPILNPDCLKEIIAPVREPLPPPANPRSLGTNPRRSQYSQEYEAFWVIYPKNGASKHKTFISYQKAIKIGVSHADLARVAGAYASWIARTGTYTANATTWLNERRWEIDYDGLDVTAKPKPAEPAKSGWQSEAEAIIRRRHGDAVAAEVFGANSAGGRIVDAGHQPAMCPPEAVRKDTERIGNAPEWLSVAPG